MTYFFTLCDDCLNLITAHSFNENREMNASSCTTTLTTEQRISECKRDRLVYRVSHISLSTWFIKPFPRNRLWRDIPSHLQVFLHTFMWPVLSLLVHSTVLYITLWENLTTKLNFVLALMREKTPPRVPMSILQYFLCCE